MATIKNTLTLAALIAATVLRVVAQNPVNVLQAGSFSGQDMCVKLRAAAEFAVTNGVHVVDATSFVGNQPCSVDPVVGLAPSAAPANLKIILGGVHILSLAPWVINNSTLSLVGAGPFETQVEYVGAAQVPAVLATDGAGSGNGLTGVEVSGIFFLGGHSNAIDTAVLQDVNRSSFSNLRFWGATSCGLHLEGAVSDRFDQPKVSAIDAQVLLGSLYGDYGVPAEGFCLDKSYVTGNQTTNSTFLNAAAEFVTGIGIHLISAQTTTWTSSTSEFNGYGLVMDAEMFNKFNTFIGLDLESNKAWTTGVDIKDQGQSDVFINLLALSTCNHCSSVSLTGGGGHVIQGGYVPTGVTGELQ